MIAAAAAVVGLSTLPAGAASGQVVAFDGVSTSLDPPMRLAGGSGSFTFQSQFCEEASPVNACFFDGGASYTTIVCGTGSAAGYAWFSPRPGTEILDILFVAGVGILTGSGYGLIDMVPMGVGSNRNCLTRFRLVGVVDP